MVDIRIKSYFLSRFNGNYSISVVEAVLLVCQVEAGQLLMVDLALKVLL